MSRSSKSAVAMETHLNYEEREADYQHLKPVTTQIKLIKTGRPSENMDKELVLRRIRHRQRVNGVKGALRSIFSFPFGSNTTPPAATVPFNAAATNDDDDADIDVEKGNGKGDSIDNRKNALSAEQNTTRRWVDDPFAAL